MAWLVEVRGQGGISMSDEMALLREYDRLLAELRAEKTRVATEYPVRVERDGEAAAQAWVVEQVNLVGARQGEQMRRLIDTLPAPASGHEPGPV